MFDGIIAAAAFLSEARGVRCVVLSGAGRGFCAGLDLASMAGVGAGEVPLTVRTHGNANRWQEAAMCWRKLPIPVIAAVHGACLGGGLQVASGADLRIVAPDARLSIMEMRWGIVPDMGGYALWRGNVRDDVLREQIYTHCEFGGEEAVALGFATHVDADPLTQAMVLAQDIAGKSPQAIRAAKALSNRAHDLAVDEVLMAESEAQAMLLNSPNQREAMRAGLERRPPEFVDT
jgi:enoyl-CoA hydratase/carnithine racemase